MQLLRNNSPVIAIAGDQAILNLELKKCIFCHYYFTQNKLYYFLDINRNFNYFRPLLTSVNLVRNN